MVKIYTIYAANKAGTQVVIVPKGFEGYTIGAKVVWEIVNGRLVLEFARMPLKPLEVQLKAEPSPILETL